MSCHAEELVVITVVIRAGPRRGPPFKIALVCDSRLTSEVCLRSRMVASAGRDVRIYHAL